MQSLRLVVSCASLGLVRPPFVRDDRRALFAFVIVEVLTLLPRCCLVCGVWREVNSAHEEDERVDIVRY